jgi:predicted RNA-binding Zn-ribbon protein involved in translation (DUF1610 family)
MIGQADTKVEALSQPWVEPTVEQIPPSGGKTCRECGGPLGQIKGKVCGRCLGKRGSGRKHVKQPHPQPAPQAVNTPIDSEGAEVRYFCDSCGTRVHYLQRKCPKCGIYNDWRKTMAENDPDTVICPECGTYCGHVEDNPSKCPHCNEGG